MLKFGCCLNMNAKDEYGIGYADIEAVAAAGFDYVELPLAEMMALDAGGVSRLKNRLRSAGMRCYSCNNFFPKGIRLTGEDRQMPRILEYVAASLNRAAEMGACRIVFGSGPAKNVPDGFPMERGYDQVVELLRRVGAMAEQYGGLLVTIEPLRKAECNLINRFSEGVQLARDVASRHIRVLVDFYHLSVEDEPLSHLERDGAAYLRHVHFAHPSGRCFPLDSEAAAAYVHFFRTLKQIGYTGGVSLEAYSGDLSKEAPIANRVLRQVSDLAEHAVCG